MSTTIISPYFVVSQIRDMADVVRNTAAEIQETECEDPRLIRVLGASVATLAHMVWAIENHASSGMDDRFLGIWHQQYEDFHVLLALCLALDKAEEDPGANPLGIGPAWHCASSAAEMVADRFVEWAKRHEPALEPKAEEVAS